jgi:hypothetical protein
MFARALSKECLGDITLGCCDPPAEGRLSCECGSTPEMSVKVIIHMCHPPTVSSRWPCPPCQSPGTCLRLRVSRTAREIVGQSSSASKRCRMTGNLPTIYSWLHRVIPHGLHRGNPEMGVFVNRGTGGLVEKDSLLELAVKLLGSGKFSRLLAQGMS